MTTRKIITVKCRVRTLGSQLIRLARFSKLAAFRGRTSKPTTPAFHLNSTLRRGFASAEDNQGLPKERAANLRTTHRSDNDQVEEKDLGLAMSAFSICLCSSGRRPLVDTHLGRQLHIALYAEHKVAGKCFLESALRRRRPVRQSGPRVSAGFLCRQMVHEKNETARPRAVRTGKPLYNPPVSSLFPYPFS
jgi:hypothetical protein